MCQGRVNSLRSAALLVPAFVTLWEAQRGHGSQGCFHCILLPCPVRMKGAYHSRRAALSHTAAEFPFIEVKDYYTTGDSLGPKFREGTNEDRRPLKTPRLHFGRRQSQGRIPTCGRRPNHMSEPVLPMPPRSRPESVQRIFGYNKMANGILGTE
jgi:hypothetical protein